MAFVEAKITVSAPISGKRPPGTNWDEVSPVTYPVQSAALTWSWGSEPGQANVIYLSENPITIGSAVRLDIGAYHFAGICERVVPRRSDRGNTRELTITDYRKWLKWDKCYCQFNVIEDTMVDGVRRRRFWHILPNNFSTLRRSWTVYPYTAAQIINLVLSGPGIETPWTIHYVDADGVVNDGYHPNLQYAQYSIDCLGGKPIDTFLTDICSQAGLLFTLMPTAASPFRLVFGQKGVDGPDVTAPALANNIETGTELSGNPTRVRVLGDRNLYQVHDINLVPDWNTNWTQFYDINVFVDYVFRNFITWDNVGDPEQIIARQQALSLALEMTLDEFDYQMSLKGGVRGYWLDDRLYSGKCRNTMPCALYIQNVLFRCFRLPSNFWFKNTYGQTVWLDSLSVADKMLAQVSHNPANGLTDYNLDGSPDGNAYVVVKGYQVGKDAFESIKPERFNVTEWLSSQDIWQKIDVRIEDSNDLSGPVIVFEEPVIRSEDLVTMVDGYAVFNASPTITVPPAMATLTFAAERFSWFQTAVLDPGSPPSDPVMGTQTHDEVLNIGGLYGEFINLPGKSNFEIYYADDKSCRYKAIENANNFLRGQWVHARGSFTVPLDPNVAYHLHGKIDRLGLNFGPQGNVVDVTLTDDRDRMNYLPERDLDRTRQLMTLIPGQAELRRQSESALKIAMSAATSKDAYRLLADAFNGVFVERDRAKPVTIKPPSVNPVPVGSVFIKTHNAVSDGKIVNTRPELQRDAPNASHEFAGVAVRNNEPADAAKGAVVKLQSEGIALALVRGPVAVNDSLVTAPLSETHDALVKSGSDDDTENSVAVGSALQAIAGETEQLIRVKFGAGDAATMKELIVCSPDTGAIETWMVHAYKKADPAP